MSQSNILIILEIFHETFRKLFSSKTKYVPMWKDDRANKQMLMQNWQYD